MPWSTIGIVALVIGIGAALLVLWWRLPKQQMERLGLEKPKERADVEDNFRKTIGQLLGGAAVLIGAVFAYFQFLQQQQASRDLLISNQVAKGFEQLGGDKPVVRLGGIYALEGVMNVSEQYHQPALEALCAFVRDNTRLDNKTVTDRPSVEIQTALTVIGRRVAGTGKPNLADARIPYARMVGADLRGADVSDTNLTNADLRRAKLSGAALSRANLSYADLTGTNLVGADLRGTKLSGAELSGADLSGVQGAAELDYAHLKGAHLIGADLSSSNLRGANLTDALLINTNLKGANLTKVNLSGADLTRAGIRSTSGADLTGANLSGANLSKANLTDAKYDKDTKLPNGFNPGERGMNRVD